MMCLGHDGETSLATQRHDAYMTTHATCSHPATRAGRAKCRSGRRPVLDGTGHKRCTKCHEVKALTEFTRDRGNADGLRADCRVCVNAAAKARRDANREYVMMHGAPRDQSESKLCIKCHEAKDRTEFNRHASNADGLRSRCRTCDSANREANREYLTTHGAPGNPVELKTCGKCGEVKARGEFSVNASNADGLVSKCKRCRVEYLRAKRIADPTIRQAISHRRRANKREADCGCVTSDALKLVVEAYGNACVYCAGPVEHIDHLAPLARGGQHCIENLRPSCGSCNTSKNATDLDDWLARRPDLSGDLAREVHVTCEVLAA